MIAPKRCPGIAQLLYNVTFIKLDEGEEEKGVDSPHFENENK